MTNSAYRKPDKSKSKNNEYEYLLRLYIAGQTPNCMTALKNLEKICEEHLQNRYQIEVVDLIMNPKLAEQDQILAIPTVIKLLPLPFRKAIGSLSNEELVLIGLDLCPKESPDL